MLGTMQTLQVAPKLDGKALAAVEKQFKDKMKAMGKTVEEIDAAWSALEANFGDGDAINALTNIDNKLKEVADETGNTDAEMQQISNTAETTGAMGEKSFEGTKASLESVGNACGAVGGAMMGVGAAFSAVGGMIRSLGFDAAADALDTVGQVIMFVGSALMLIPPIISIINLALSTPPIGIIMLIIGAIIIGLTLIISLITSIAKSNSTAEKLKAAGEEANKAKENAKAAKEAFDALLEEKSEYDGLSKTIDNLTEGTTEWKNAVNELSKKILGLIEMYPQLAQYANWDKGYLDISQEGWDYLLEQQAQVVANAQAIAAQKQVKVAQFNVDAAVDDMGSAYSDFSEAIGGIEGQYLTLYGKMNKAMMEFGIESQEYYKAVAEME
jgi:ABC-type multidrug transport system fused ATPase/permease subunit